MSERKLLTDSDMNRAMDLTQRMLAVMQDEDTIVCQAALITLMSIGCMITADGNRLRALGLVDKMCLDVKYAVQHSELSKVEVDDDEDDAGLRDG